MDDWMPAMRVARLALVAALLLGACNGGRDDDVLPPRPTSTDTTAVDYSVPAVIDVAYVEKVMAALDRVYGDGIRTLAKERAITQEFLEHLVAIYGDRFYRLAQDAWTQELSTGASTLAARPGDPHTTITALRQVDRACVVAQVVRDFSATRSSTPAVTPTRYIGLVPLIDQRDTRGLNPTPWMLAYDGWTPNGDPPVEPCAAS